MALPADDIVQWLAAARTGSREALGRALDACRAYLLMVARKELDKDLQAKVGASDLVQETFLEAQRDFERFHGKNEEEWLAWLRQLLLHNIANFTRSFRTAKRQVESEVSLQGGSSGKRCLGLVTPDGSPSDQVIAAEQAQQVQDAVARLPEDYRKVLLLRFQGNHSFEEIGRVTRKSANAARKLFGRAIERLRGELERD